MPVFPLPVMRNISGSETYLPFEYFLDFRGIQKPFCGSKNSIFFLEKNNKN